MDLYDYYKNYYKITKQQKEKIINDEIDNLQDLIEQKQEIIKQIEENTDLEDYLRNQDNPKEAFEELKKLLNDINALEEANTKRAEDKKDELLEDMNSLNQKAKSRKGYLAQNKFEAKFIDKKS